MRQMIFGFWLLAIWGAAISPAVALELQRGDHICLIGNTLAERMQHHGWLETLILARYPQHELVFRNLGYSGDQVGGYTAKPDFHQRLRSMDFGTGDQWLSGKAPVPQPKKLNPNAPVRENRFETINTKADVILAFFGYNESYADEAGLAKFKETLAAMLQHLKSQKYNGKSAPRVVLISPIAHEALPDRNLNDGTANNDRLRLYTTAMAEVAKAEKVEFVDLFSHTRAIFVKNLGSAHTINGIHLNAAGDKAVAQIIDTALFGPAPQRDASILGALRLAVNDKNALWYQRYRATDGYSTFGDRAFLRFVDGQTNYEVLQRELEVIDIMVSNRDRAIWSVAQGKPSKINDGNLPPFIPVETNKPGPLPDKKHVFLGGEEAISKMTVGKGLKVELFASEEKFPQLINPVQMAFDTKGRLWVATWPTYPHWKPTEPMNDALLILEDTNGDGKADVCKPFAEDLHNPTGFEFWGGGVLVGAGPDILFLKDTNGDDKYDIKERVVHGLDTADTHHTANSFTLDPGGAMYFQEGTFHHSQIETPWGEVRRVANGAVFRYEPRAQKTDVYVSYGFANPHGHAFDRWGSNIVVDGTGAVPYHATLFSGHVNYPNKHGGTPSVYKQRTRPCSAIEFLSSSHFGEEFRGNLLVLNVIGFQGILRYKMQDQDSSLGATELEPMLSSSDVNFRPADVETAPDGSLYFTDWQNPIIGHMQHNLRDPSRDRIHGRVYRVTAEGKPLVKPAKIAGESIENLLALLKSPDDRVVYRAKIELSSRNSDEVIVYVNKWLTTLDKNDPDYEYQTLQALWMHQHHNVVNSSLLERVLASPESRARAAGVKVAVAWRDRLSNALALVNKAAGDESPRVRLEAVRAASFFTVPEAVEAALIASDLPADQALDHVTKETMRTLQPLVDAANKSGQRMAFSTEAGSRYYLKNLSNQQLLKEKRDRLVLIEMLNRPGLDDATRRGAVRDLAKLDNKPELRVVMDAIQALDAKQSNVDTSVIFDLVRQLTGRSAAELSAARAELEKLATAAKQPLFRQIGLVSLINVDGDVDKVWALAVTDAKKLEDFVNALPLISDVGTRASLYDKIEPLLNGLPPALRSNSGKGTAGRYVRVEILGPATLTLAEVEVYSGGENVARQGRANQKNISVGGLASRGIDGKKSGVYTDGGQTHTEENTLNPFWEVDLGREVPIEKIVIYNRTDEELGRRLNNFTLKVLDDRRQEAFKAEKQPAPKVSAEFAFSGGGPEVAIRRAAMQALTTVRGQEGKTFAALAKFVRDDADRAAAIRALQRLPRASWPREAAPELTVILLAAIEKLPPAERTSPAALDMLEFTDALASLLPADAAKPLRAKLGELGVRVIKLNTVFEKMAYDKDVLVVQAGKPVEFVLDNSDLMPHNFVILQPGSLEEVGMLAEESAQLPGFAEQQFVPKSDKVLAKSKLMPPRETQRVSFIAPTKPGVYPYVCTYPGHWRRMYGALYVVPDLDEYQANPEAYLAANKIMPVDPLLKDRRPRTEWKLDELAVAVNELPAHGGRNFQSGREMFKVATCISCHKMEGQGREFGPDLLKIEPKWQPAEVLEHILNPAKKIDEKYQSWTFELDSGKTLTGMIMEEAGGVVKVIENPLAKTDTLDLPVTSIESRSKLPTSLMPKGLLDQLTRDEILDLMAYVIAKGDKAHPAFKPATDGHDHGHAH